MRYLLYFIAKEREREIRVYEKEKNHVVSKNGSRMCIYIPTKQSSI